MECSQAESLGVQIGWRIESIDGVDVRRDTAAVQDRVARRIAAKAALSVVFDTAPAAKEVRISKRASITADKIRGEDSRNTRFIAHISYGILAMAY